MKTIGERIKFVRQSKDCTQQKFADVLGLKRNTIATYELDKTTPRDRTIADICREFRVNEHWLRTGEGEMQTPVMRDAAIAAFMGDVLKGEDGDFRRRLIAVLSQLDADEWKLLEQMALKLSQESKKEDQA